MRFGPRAAILATALVAGLSARPAAADPNEGEARSILRDADRIYTTVAGEADAGAVIMNPANLGYLRGWAGLLDAAFTRSQALRRGSGAGAFLATMLPYDFAALGIGYQVLFPNPPAPGDSANVQPGVSTADEVFSKLTMALAVPIERWVPGLSLGLSYSRLISRRNFFANGVNQLDLAASYWVNRFLALGLVARGINQPETGGLLEDAGNLTRITEVMPLALDPEIAFRPLGRRVLEIGVGARIYPTPVPGTPRFHVGIADSAVVPRGRLLIQGNGVRFFAQAEPYRFYPSSDMDVADRTAVRLSAGFELDFPHVGFGVGGMLGANGASEFGFDGVAGRVRISEERYAALPVRPRRVTRIPLAKYSGDRGMWRAIEELERLGEGGGVVVLETTRMGLRYAQLEELREAVLRMRSRGGKVVVYMDGGSLRHYFLASAADRVIAHPHNSLAMVGMSGTTFYYQTILEKLGAKADFVRIAEYKGVPESYHRTTASDEVRAQRQMLRADVWNHVLRLVARERGHDPLTVRDWIDEAPIPPARAQRLGIVDALAFPDQLDEELERWLGKPVRITKPPKQPAHRDSFGPPVRVAVLNIEGDLLDSPSVTIPLINRKIAGSFTLTKEIEKLRKDAGVKAVVVRINSPGGSVSAADAIARELDLLRAEKPVVISMGSACASGGYYIATGGQYIYADATTVTGSIGIFYPKMDLSGFIEKFGVSVDQEGLGKRALMRSWWKGYNEDERAAAMADIRHSYDIFIERVARARSLEPEKVDAELARGRVWSGVRALDVGLVDSYGGLREAIMRARNIAGLRPDEGQIQMYPGKAGLLAQVRALFGLKLPNPLGGGTDSGPWNTLSAGAVGLPAPILVMLRQLSPALWMVSEPEPLALDPEPTTIE